MNRERSFSSALAPSSTLGNLLEVDKWVKMQLIIEDNGVGISDENIDKLFKDYGRLKEHQRLNNRGTGLGLIICKKLIT